MDVVNLTIDRLREAPWNPNTMPPEMVSRLRESLRRFGNVENLVIRLTGDNEYEVINGNQRLQVLREMGATEVPCVVVDLDDAHARLLAQALNRIEGVDDLGLKAELIRKVLEEVPQAEVLALLPEKSESLTALASLGQEDIAKHLEAWQKAQTARLRHLQFQLTDSQLESVEEALARASTVSGPTEGSPNRRGTALTAICRAYLDLKEETS